jgi:penicillin-binding protein 2
VQIVHARDFQASMETQHYRTVRMPALRGMILDRTGKVLADNRPSFNVSLYLEDLPPQFRAEYARLRPRQVVTNVAPFWKFWAPGSQIVTQTVRLNRTQREQLEWLARYNVASNTTYEISRRLQQPAGVEFVPFKQHYIDKLPLPYSVMKGLTPAQLARFGEQFSTVPGVDLVVSSSRVYPYENTAAHLLGYLRKNNDSVDEEEAYYSYRLPDYRGVIGIEGGLDAVLRGRAGLKSVLVNSLGYRKSESIWTPVVPGWNVTLTIDIELQQAVEAALRKRIDRNQGAAVVVMEVHTGDVLALASAPCGNPNYFIRGFPSGEGARWTNETYGVQKNRATRENYQAGSIFKTMVALAALENGLNPLEEITVEANPKNQNRGIIYVGRTREPVDDTAPPGKYTLRRAIVRSSNAYFVEVGLRPGVFERVIELGRRLHLGDRFGTNALPLLQDAPGHFPTAERIRRNWNPGNTAHICIGQGMMDVTPLQMAVMTSALANGGKVLWPRLVSRIEPPDPTSLEQPVVTPPGRVREELGVSANNLRIVRDAMLAETEDPEGTGRAAAVPGLRVCGKTGTAERIERGQKLNTVWFASYAPADQPRYAVVVMAENGQSGGATCAPVAHDVYTALLQMEARRSGASLAQTRN